MANLLSPAVRQRIQNAFGDIYDTFFLYTCDIVVRTRKPDKFKRDRDEMFDETPYQVRCLPVPDKGDTDAENLILRKGTTDFTEGRLIFSRKDLEDTGLFANNVCLVNPATDTVSVDGIKYRFLGINNVGAIDGTYELVFFQVKKAMK